MHHISYYYQEQDAFSFDQFQQFLAHNTPTTTNTKSCLIQVFSSHKNLASLQRLLDHLLASFPSATIIGASTAGEIHQQDLHEGGVLIGITWFHTVSLTLASTHLMDARTAGKELASQIVNDSTQSVIAFADGLKMNGEAFISGMSEYLPTSIPIAGGMSGDTNSFTQCYVIAQNNIIFDGAVAVALNGHHLKLWQHYNLSWRPIGQSMEVTKSEGNIVYEIDHRPVVDIYHDYLGADIVADLPTTASEFPLVFEQHGIHVARSMIATNNPDGSLPYAGEIPTGTKVRFGIASAQLLAEGRETLSHEIAANQPDVIFSYSCMARRMFLGETISAEFAPLSQVAPVIGFFTYGEFYGTPVTRQLLNITTTILALKESTQDNVIQRPIAPITKLKSSLTTQALLNLVDKVSHDLAKQEIINQRLNQAIDKVLIISRTNTKGIITYANELFCRISGFSIDELLGQPHNIVRHPDTPSETFKDMWQTIRHGNIWHGIIKNKTKLGDSYTVKSFIIPQIDDHGHIVEYLAIREDVSDLINTQESLKQQQLFTSTVMDLSESIVLIMKDEKPFSISGYFFELLGYENMQQFMHQHSCICELFIAKEGFLQPSTPEYQWFEPILNHPEQLHKAIFKDRFGQERIYAIKIKIMPFEVKYMVVTMSEITEIEQAREAALSAKSQQEQFLASMSHEIRTPLNGVLGFLTLLNETNLDTTQRHYLDIIQNSSQTLLSIINDILDVSKINQGAMTIDPHPINLKQELPLFGSLYDASALQKNIQYQIDIDPRLHSCLTLDWLRLKQIIGNLVGNAIKFTPNDGKVVLSIHVVKDNDHQQEILFSVKDTGIGIAPEKQAQVFNAFAQADNSTARQYGGTGLGLSISAKLALLMQSELTLKSTLGVGSEFSFVIHTDKCHDSFSAIKHPIQTLTKTSNILLNVLVAEDNTTNRMLIKALLAKQDINPDFAENGLEAVEMIQSKPYDLVLMDIHMPFMDGVEATQKIRQLGYSLPIVALTANALEGERERLLSLGMDDYLTKPIDVNLLNRLLQKYRAQDDASTAQTTA